MLQTIFRHQRRGSDTIRHQILPKIQNPLRQLRDSAFPIRSLVSGPGEFSKSSGARPHFRGDGGVVGLLGPEGGGDAEDARGFGGGEVGGEVVVVDALPGFVGGAPVFFVSIKSWMGMGWEFGGEGGEMR